MKQILNQLQPGEAFELKHAYIGDKQQLFARVIFNRLTGVVPAFLQLGAK